MGQPAVTRKTIEAVKRAGFDAIRIPIRWQCHITNSAAMSISKTWMARIKEVVGYCLDCDMKVIINVHHEKWLESRPTYACREENCRRLALLWNNIASEFRDYDYRLAFAGTNEVHEKDNWGALRRRIWRCRMPIIRCSSRWSALRAATTPNAT